MAILSNINDLFRVDSAGAVYFGTSAGTNGQILKSVGTGGSPVWIDQTDITGPFVLKAGDTMTGPLVINGSNSLTVGGTLTGTTATFGGNVDVTGNIIARANASYYATRNYLGETWEFASDTADGVTFKITGGAANTTGNFFKFQTQAGGATPATALTINKNGNVGINTATPQKKLHIEGTGDVSEMQILVSSASDTVGHTAGIGLRGEGGEADGDLRIKGGIFFERIAGSFGNGKMILAVNSSVNNTSVTVADHALTIDTNKNVGIGTTSPQGKLHISNTSTQLILETPNTINDIDFRFRENGTNKWNMRYQNSTNDLQFLNQTGTAFVQLELSANGNVGIGTDSPEFKLDVKSNSDTAPSTYLRGGKSSQGEIQNTGLILGTQTTMVAGDYQGISFTGYTSSSAIKRGRAAIGVEAINGPGKMDLVFMTRFADDGTQLSASDEKMRIDSSGNVIVSNGGLFLNKSDGAYVALKHNNSLKGYLGIANQVITGGTTGDIGLTATSNLVLGSGGTTERIRITSTGQLQLQGSSSSVAKSTTQTEWAYIPSNTPGASLMSQNPSGMSSASAGYHIVYGANNSSPYQAFIDVITYMCGSSTSVTTVSSTNLNGSPGSRAYSKNSNAVFLNISGLGVNYNCNVKTTFINYPH